MTTIMRGRDVPEIIEPPRPIQHHWLWQAMVPHRTVLQVLADLFAWTVALPVAFTARSTSWHDWASHLTQPRAWLIPALAVTIQVGAGISVGAYRGRYSVGSFEQARFLAVLVTAVTVALLLVDIAPERFLVPRSVMVFAGLTSLAISLVIRGTWRMIRTNAMRSRVGSRALIFGAGEGGSQLLRAVLATQPAGLVPVGFLDDDPWKRNRRILGLRVHGTRADLVSVARKLAAEVLVVAIPTASSELLRDVNTLAEAADLKVLVLPPVGQLLGQSVSVADVRALDVVDLLGRRPVDTDIESIAHYLTGKRVLVTGAGGSIGSELCRQVSRFEPERLIMLDRDESALHQTQLSIEGRALLDSPDIVLADIRDLEHLDRIFAETMPQVVFHAAALKHMPLLERFPAEAVKTNVWGTHGVLAAAVATGVEQFVNISTDKAANPRNALGYSKRLAEQLTAHHALQARGTFMSVRFGNVLGSRGSVLTAFTAQAANGGPLTVTHEEVTRYFMTVEEAVQLVIQAGAIGRAGEVLVLDMGEPVRIADVANQIAAKAPTPVDVVFTGLRPGEKLHEELFGDGEADIRPVHHMIAHVPVPAIDPIAVFGIDAYAEVGDVLEAMRRLCGTPIADFGSEDVVRLVACLDDAVAVDIQRARTT